VPRVGETGSGTFGCQYTARVRVPRAPRAAVGAPKPTPYPTPTAPLGPLPCLRAVRHFWLPPGNTAWQHGLSLGRRRDLTSVGPCKHTHRARSDDVSEGVRNELSHRS